MQLVFLAGEASQPVNCYEISDHGVGYAGQRNYTANGLPCVSWSHPDIKHHFPRLVFYKSVMHLKKY